MAGSRATTRSAIATVHRLARMGKGALVGKNVLDLLPALNATSGIAAPGGSTMGADRRRSGAAAGGCSRTPATGNFVAVPNRSGGTWPDYKAAAADVCLWTFLAKRWTVPIYKLLGGKKDRMMAYASSRHLPSIEDYVPDALKARTKVPGYKIHPGAGQHRTGRRFPATSGTWRRSRSCESAGRQVRLMHDPVQAYNRFEALKVGRLLDELDYLWFEDPIRTTDLEGLVELAGRSMCRSTSASFWPPSRILPSTSSAARSTWCG